jgi:hypothetical protein
MTRQCLAILILFPLLQASVAAQQDPAPPSYPVPAVHPPTLVRPAIDVNRQLLPRGAMGTLPTFDGEPFQVNLLPSAGPRPSPAQAREVVEAVLRAIGWDRRPEELRAAQEVESPAVTATQLREKSAEAQREMIRDLNRRHGGVSQAAQAAIAEDTELLASGARGTTVAFPFQQVFDGVPFDNTSIRATWREGSGIVAVGGRVFRTVNIANRRVLDAAAAREAAEAHVRRYSRIPGGRPEPPVLVILPYGEALLYAWRLVVEADEGPYRVWVDAEDGRVLQLEPDFFPQTSAQGLVFNPVPASGTLTKSFRVDDLSGGVWRLRHTGVLTVNNSGADGQCTGALELADNGTGGADFNVAPFNGLVVTRTNQANYNCRFQDVNAYGWVYSLRDMWTTLGSQPFAAITATVNHNNPCNFGINNACASGTATLVFGIGAATTGTSTACGDIFNSAIDASVVSHELGHLLNRIQYNASGGTLTGETNEGVADYWSHAAHNSDTFGAFWGGNCAAASQDGWTPRVADQTDFFPTRVQNASSPHGRGQVIAWALWSSRTGARDLNVLGALVHDHHLIAALASGGVGVTTGTQAQRVHNAFNDVYGQFLPRYANSRAGHKVAAGFARAGLFLAPADAVIDIDDDFLDRNSATGPTFTAWAGRAYGFNANETVNTTTQPCNTRVVIEVANDEAFTQNLRSSGTLNTTAGSGSCSVSWTVPNAAWTTLRAADQLFYRATTTNATGGNARTTGSPGNGVTSLPPARAIVNVGGTNPCTCATAGGAAGAFLFVVPFLVGILGRRRARRTPALDANDTNGAG